MIALGKKLAQKISPGNVLALHGGLGAGKTTLVKGIALGLGILDDIKSPTYTIICEYDSSPRLYHMDLYRISDSEEFELLGANDMLYSDGVCLIEWAEKAKGMLPDDTVRINIIINDDNSRKVEIYGIEL